MKHTISLRQAASLALSSFKLPIITAYQLGKVVFDLYLAGEIAGQRLEVKKALPERRHFREVVQFLVEHGVLHSVRGFPEGSVYSLIGGADPSANELICTVDPYAYISHLSAMAIHGLTDRIPYIVYVSSPAPAHWREFANDQMRKDLGKNFANYIEAGFPPLLRTRFDKVMGQPVHLTKSSHMGAFKKMEPQRVRVSTIGRTFLDMLRDADLCGGMQHVMDVYRQHAKAYLPLIVAEVQQHGTDIDRVRAGYVLEERCGLNAPAFAAWLSAVARGGSRKLVANRPYSAKYSEKWCLSLNAE